MGEDDPRSTEELIRLALTANFDDELQEDENGNLVWPAGKQARLALKKRATRDVLEGAQQLCTSSVLNERYLGINILGELGIPDRTCPDECLQTLLGLLDDPDPDILEATCYALGHLKHPGAVPSLVKLKNHPIAEIRYAVTFGLLTHADNRAVEALIELSEDEDEDVRDWATFGLGTQIDLDTPEIREALVRRLNDSIDPHGEAMVGLARRKDERVLKPLLESLASESPRVYSFIAAQELADSRLYQPLLDLKARSEDTDSSYWLHELDDAIAACIPKPPTS
jgi:HEAT repeat protein